MQVEKPIHVFYSEAAAQRAGANLKALHQRLIEEVTLIAADAEGWFIHAVPISESQNCYECRGQETDEAWEVDVRAAEFMPMAEPEASSPTSGSVRRTFQFPQRSPGPDNERFDPVETLLSRQD